MFEPASFKRFQNLVVWGCLVGSIAGCGTGEYDRRLTATLSAIRNAPKPKAPLTEFADYSKSTALVDGQVDVRLPKAFTKFLTESSVDPKTNTPLAPYQLYPAAVKLPGYKRTIEAQVKASDGSVWPYFMYFAAVKAEPGSLEKLAQELTTLFKAAIPTTPDRWQDAKLVTPEGNHLPALRIRIEGELRFLDPDAGEQPFPGVIEIYLCELGGYQAIVGSQCMQNYEEHTKLPDFLEATAGTLRVPPAVPARTR